MSDKDLKQLALDEIIAQSLPRTQAGIDKDFYEGVLSPVETDITGKGDPPLVSPTPFQDLYDREFAPGDKLYKEAMSQPWIRSDQADQGPGTKGYKQDSPEEQARMFGAKLNQILKRGKTP